LLTTQQTNFKLIIANLIGTLLEIYDMSIYAYFAPMIAQNFFPTSNKQIALLNTFAIFMVSFFVRPLGAVVFGHIGDTLGRKKTLVLTISLISLGTFGIGILPTTNQIGLLAPILLVVFRVVQGLSFSGEFVGSLIFLMEHAPPNRKGFMSSWAICGGNIGLLIASLLCCMISHFCDKQQLMSWGWRIPFLLALFGGAISLYFRYQIVEVFPLKMASIHKYPLAEVLKTQKKSLLLILSLTCFYMVVCYLLYVCSATYLSRLADISMSRALAINSIALFLQAIMIPIIGSLSDKIGRKYIMRLGILGLIASVYPYYLTLENGNLFWVCMAHVAISFIATFFTSVLPITLAELFPVGTRYSGVGLGYNMAAMLVGGATPALALYILKVSNGTVLLSLYFIFWAFLALIGTIKLDRKHATLPADDIITVGI
jgi:MHS family proline/betaine transporter-like MFS transporter